MHCSLAVGRQSRKMRMEHEQSGKRRERKSCGWLLLDNHDEEWMYYRQKQTVSLSRNLCNTRREDMTASKKSMDWNQTRSWRARAFTQWLNDKNVERVPACEIQPFTVGLGVFLFPEHTRNDRIWNNFSIWMRKRHVFTVIGELKLMQINDATSIEPADSRPSFGSR